MQGMTVRELKSILDERERANNQRFDAQEKAVAAALAAAKEAVIKAESAAEKRFDSVNEFRATLKDQQLTLLPRNEADIKFRSIDDSMGRLNQAVAKAQGAIWLWGALVGLAVLAVGVLNFISRH